MNPALVARQTTETSLRDTLGVLKRRKWLILAIMLASLLAGLLTTFLLPNTYRSTALMLVEGRANNTNAQVQADPLSEFIMPSGTYDILTQMQLLQSFDVLSQAFRQANVVLPPPGSDTPAPLVRVNQIGQTNVLAVSVDASDADTALRLARAIPDVYLDYIKAKRSVEIDTTVEYLKTQKQQEETQLQEAQKALDAFRATGPLVAIEAQGGELAARYSRATVENRMSEAFYQAANNRYNSLVAEKAKLTPTIEGPNDRTNYEIREQARQRLADLRGQRAALVATFLPDAPQVREIDGQIQVAQRRLAEIPTTAKIDTRVRNPLLTDLEGRIAQAKAERDAAQAARDRHASWEAEAAKQLRDYNATQPRQAQLQLNVQTLGQALQVTVTKLQELVVRQKAVRNPVTTISQASIPAQISPNVPLVMTLFTILGIVLSTAIVALREHLDDRVNSVAQANSITSAPALGHIPAVKALSATTTGPNPLAESYRSLAYNLLFSTTDNPAKSVMVASSNPREGKSTVAANLAETLASEQRRVVLVDANLRRPTLAKRLKVQEKPGLTDVLTGAASLESAIQATGSPGLFVITAGATTAGSSELLNSQAMRDLHTRLKDEYDFVVLDSPATLLAADSQVLAAVADSVIYVAQLGLTRKNALRYGLDLLRNAHARILGVVYTNSKGHVETTPYDDLDI
jgi:capsular exopolysaccharide synthesis family protein